MSTKINLDRMHERHYALTESIAGAYEEAASVCLSRHHNSPLSITLSDNSSHPRSAEISWTAPSPRALAAWANKTDTTEMGAYGCVISGLELLRNLLAVRRAETGTGADYYVGPKGSGLDDLEECFRLEVSGVNDGDAKDVATRLLQKVQQAREGESDLPALAGVMGFRAMLLMLQDVTEEP
jgi:hypothetical protein